MIEMFQHYSKYARFNEEKGRRETWPETCDRVVGWFEDKFGHVDIPFRDLRAALEAEEMSFSMRAVQMAGAPATRENVTLFNCAYTPVEDLKDMADALYIMMQGTGLAFSVESKYVAKLPVVMPATGKHTEIVIEDHTESWCDGLLRGLTAAYEGLTFDLDVSRVRPAGARLKTKGGFASGPEPLVGLIRFAEEIIRGAEGRQLRPFEVHRIMCKIGQIVQVGGVRRAAMLGLSDIWDEEMRAAKNGMFWEKYPELTMANNSAAYRDDAAWDLFGEEFKNLVASGSGERGIFTGTTRVPRKSSELGTNPCVVGDTWVDTTEGPRQVKDLVGRQFTAIVAGEAWPSTPDGFFSKGVKDVYRLTLKSGQTLDLTEDHKVIVKGKGGVAAKDLTPDDRVMLNDQALPHWPDPDGLTREHGWLLGSFWGDGTVATNTQVRLTFWGPTQDHMVARASQIHEKAFGHPLRFNVNGVRREGHSRALHELATKLGFCNRDARKVFGNIEDRGYDFLCGFMQGWFDADGTIIDGVASGSRSARLSSSDMIALSAAQRIAQRLGAPGRIYKDRQPAGPRRLPDGRGGHKMYECRASNELDISGKAFFVFQEKIGFSDPVKAERAAQAIAKYSKGPYSNRPYSKVRSLEPIGQAEVFDCTIPGPHVFVGNGVITAQCGEISLVPRQFCNLSIAIIRPNDTKATIRRKVELAAIAGTLQAACTDFKYIKQAWVDNTRDEALLGVDLQGALDNKLLQSGAFLRELRALVHATNAATAAKLGINPSAAMTCIKPSGNSGERFGTGNAITGWFAPYFIRRVYVQAAEPMCAFLMDQGVPYEDHYYDPSVKVFLFPKKAPEGAVIRGTQTALEQLDWWLKLKVHWTDHNPSATIYVRDHEWEDVERWILRNRTSIGGLAFLPYSDHVYAQAPFTECTEAEHFAAVERMPNVDWSRLADYDQGVDTTTGGQEFACTGDKCTI